jgi:hypothetical protein
MPPIRSRLALRRGRATASRQGQAAAVDASACGRVPRSPRQAWTWTKERRTCSRPTVARAEERVRQADGTPPGTGRGRVACVPGTAGSRTGSLSARAGPAGAACSPTPTEGPSAASTSPSVSKCSHAGRDCRPSGSTTFTTARPSDPPNTAALDPSLHRGAAINPMPPRGSLRVASKRAEKLCSGAPSRFRGICPVARAASVRGGGTRAARREAGAVPDRVVALRERPPLRR